VIIEGLKKYFSEYTGGIEVRNSFLSENTPDFAVFAEGEKTVLKKYISGDMLCQFIFSFRARLPYGKKDEETKKISIFFSNLADWVRKKSDENQFPQIGEGKRMQNLEALDSGKIKNTNTSDCVYEMKFKAVYYQGR